MQMIVGFLMRSVAEILRGTLYILWGSNINPVKSDNSEQKWYCLRSFYQSDWPLTLIVAFHFAFTMALPAIEIPILLCIYSMNSACPTA